MSEMIFIKKQINAINIQINVINIQNTERLFSLI